MDIATFSPFINLNSVLPFANGFGELIRIVAFGSSFCNFIHAFQILFRLLHAKGLIDLKMKLDHVGVNALLSDFGESVHVAKLNGKYVTIIESDSIIFEKSISPIEFLFLPFIDMYAAIAVAFSFHLGMIPVYSSF
ncbi:DUF3898 domain-containing protein [Peribacillus sp. NPDC096622]|uniref:DUF3898 domain-containing protein n=1 Tax=Peribacillus sp. NPDC096622 TaxID=3364396 RepID=UPI003822801E